MLKLLKSFSQGTAASAYRQARARGDRLVLGYVLAGVLWILLSDRAVEWLVSDAWLRTLVGIAKGWLFVAVTAALLLTLLRRWTAALQTLRERELADRHLLEAIARNSPDAITAKDRGGRYLFCNPAALHWMGKDAAAVIGHDEQELLPGTPLEEITALDRAILADGCTRSRELRLDTAQGPRVLLTTRGPLRDAQGAVTGVFGISRDITERTQAEEALRESQRQLQALLAHSPAAFSFKDREGRYVLANPVLQRLLGRAEAQIVGRTDEELFGPEAAAALRAHDELVLRTLERHTVEELLPVAGEPRLFLVQLFPVHDDAGAVRHICRIALDVTERRRAEQALTARNEELERFNRAMVGRELEMVALKRQVNALSRELGHEPPYPLGFDDAAAAGAGTGRP